MLLSAIEQLKCRNETPKCQKEMSKRPSMEHFGISMRHLNCYIADFSIFRHKKAFLENFWR